MYEEPRELFLTFHLDTNRINLDTNRINSRGKLENMNKLEGWRDRDLILLYPSKVAHEEAMAGGDPLRARKALENIYSDTMATTAEETQRLAEIEAVVFPTGAQTQNEHNDVEIAFNAGKYGAILITADKDLLRCRRELARLGIRIMTDNEAVDLVERRITERDERARGLAAEIGTPLPNWVGQDFL